MNFVIYRLLFILLILNYDPTTVVTMILLLLYGQRTREQRCEYPIFSQIIQTFFILN